MTKDFIAICAGALAVGIGLWGLLRHDKPAAHPEATETLRALTNDPALKLTTERSPYMRNER